MFDRDRALMLVTGWIRSGLDEKDCLRRMKEDGLGPETSQKLYTDAVYAVVKERKLLLTHDFEDNKGIMHTLFVYEGGIVQWGNKIFHGLSDAKAEITRDYLLYPSSGPEAKIISVATSQ